MQTTPRQARQILHWAGLGAACILSGIVLSALAVPAGLLIGPILVGMCFGLSGHVLTFNRDLRALAQGATGVLIATSYRPDTLARLGEVWPQALATLAGTMLVAILAGVIVGRLGVIAREEAIWGFLPGMASAVIAISEERNLDARAVAIIQVLRILVVILSMSALAAILHMTGLHVTDLSDPAQAAPARSTPHGPVWITCLLVVLAPLSQRFLRFVPAGGMMVPLIAAIALKSAGVPVGIPHEMLVAAYLVIGANVGLRFDRPLLRQAGRAMPAIIGAAIGMVLLGGGIGLALGWTVGLDPLSGVLAAVPGSIDAVAALAYSSNADMSFVMTLQILRLFVVLIAGPPLAAWAARHSAPRRR
ncbi:AbrB family transcriptional regulator [Thioclava sp. FTW29]|uniref:AbrB family transcriptional regulator n=1 Tax=Thioclava litoralis TaxID=3076557 RepID=A0ABZ1E7R9_9RHOB|nr:AbrB family transcriptional regulator [Thioclava sp. FTW29]